MSGKHVLVNDTAGFPVLSCLDGLPRPCVETNIGRDIANRVRDLEAIMGASAKFSVIGWTARTSVCSGTRAVP